MGKSWNFEPPCSDEFQGTNPRCFGILSLRLILSCTPTSTSDNVFAVISNSLRWQFYLKIAKNRFISFKIVTAVFVETFLNVLYTVRMLSYFINLFLAVIVICLNTFFFLMSITLNYYTFNLNFIHLHVTLMVYLKTKFILRKI